MNRFLVALLGAVLVVSVGCQNEDKDRGGGRGGDAMKASADVCPHCPGVQKANAEGKCPKCGMSVSAASSTGDVCPACPGVQTAKADGTCPGCGAMVAKK